MIARMWRGWVATDRAAEYVAYIEQTGLAAYRRTPGNVDAQMWTRDLGDGRTEVVIHQTNVPEEYRSAEAQAGMQTSLDKFAAYLATL